MWLEVRVYFGDKTIWRWAGEKQGHIPIIPALGRWRQEDFDEFKAG